MDYSAISTRIRQLNESELRYVYSRLRTELEIDEEPLLTEKDINLRLNQDKAFLEEVARTIQISQSQSEADKDVATHLLVIISQSFPEYHPVIAEALEELDRPNIHLDFGVTFTITALVFAIAVAIIRPRITVEQKQQKRKDTETNERKIDIQVQGVEEITKVIKAIFFLLPK